MLPRRPDYATCPIADGFSWQEGWRGLPAGRSYLVVFRSVRRPTADPDVLTGFDDHAYAGALAAGGLLHYFRGTLNERRACLSFCLWETAAQARAALSLPRHQAAVRAAGELYETFALERYEVLVAPDAAMVIVQPVP